MLGLKLNHVSKRGHWSGTTINLQSEGLGGETIIWLSLQWRHNGPDSVSNHQPHYCLLNRLFGPRSKKTSKLRVTGLCAWNSPGTSELPAQMTSYPENVSIWWRHHGAVQRVKVVEWWQCQKLGQLIMLIMQISTIKWWSNYTIG